MAHYAIEISYMDSTDVTTVELPEATHEDAKAEAMKIASGVVSARTAGASTWLYKPDVAGEVITVDLPTFLDVRAIEHDDH